jgi:D-alanyl-D-alanine carboxypeptidase/D-alanyl-D-alanine-endopeptidase (penicillin-binding protein 4)
VGCLSLQDEGVTEAIAIEDPAEFTADIFRSLLEDRGIKVMGKAKARHGDIAQFFDQIQEAEAKAKAPDAEPRRGCCLALASAVSPSDATPPVVPVVQPKIRILALHISQPLIEDIRITNKTSQNLHAELALRLMGERTQASGSVEGGLAAMKSFLHGVGLKDEEYSLTDGSGLSRRDLITPAAMVRVLLYDARQPWGPVLEETLPVAGVDGSLAERFLHSPSAGLVHAKTGTLSHLSTLSGYAQTLSGKRFAFSILCNKINAPSGKAAAAIDQIVQLLVGGADTRSDKALPVRHSDDANKDANKNK